MFTLRRLTAQDSRSSRGGVVWLTRAADRQAPQRLMKSRICG